jgi:hypothetical protein
MSHRKSAYLSVLFLSGACLLSQCVHADDLLSYGATNLPALKVSLKSGEIVGSQPVRRAYVKVGTNEFVFIAPIGFRMDASNPRKIVLSDASYTCFITFRIAGPMPDNTTELQRDTCRELALIQYSGAKISSEYSESAGGRSGPAFELRWENSNGSSQSARVVYIPSAAGILEFSVNSRSDNSGDRESSFNLVLTSFRSNQNGTIEITPIPNES